MANRNRAVLEILKLGIEFDHAVARPELDLSGGWFLDHIYVPSLLDTELKPAILADEYDVVFVTGNPGDGKSAFLGKLMGGVTNEGRGIKVKHDATQPDDPENRAASAADDLREFLRDVSDEHFQESARSDQVFLVGINRGLLEKAIFSRDSGFTRFLAPALHGEVENLKAVLVDLNKRVFAPTPIESQNDLFSEVLGRLIDRNLWEDSECGNCPDADICPFLSNASTFRERMPKDRLKSLWAVEELRGARHATMRDLLASLSSILVGHRDMFHMEDDVTSETIHPCHFVERENTSEQSGHLSLFRRLYYNSVFRDSDIYEHGTDFFDEGDFVGTSTFGFAPDSLLRMQDSDPSAGTWSPEWEDLELRVVARPERFCEQLIESRVPLETAVGSKLKASLMKTNETLAEAEPSDQAYVKAVEDRERLVYLIIGIAKRRAFFTDTDISLKSLTQYRYLEDFIRVIEILKDGAFDPLGQDFIADLAESVFPRAIMESDGQHVNELVPRDLTIRWDDSNARVAVASALTLSPEFRLISPSTKFVESHPISFEYLPLGEGESMPGMDVTLDDFELLQRVAKGLSDRYGGFARTKHLANVKNRLRSQQTERLVIRDRFNPSRKVDIVDGRRVVFR